MLVGLLASVSLCASPQEGSILGHLHSILPKCPRSHSMSVSLLHSFRKSDMNIAVASGVRWQIRLTRMKAIHRGVLEKRLLRQIASSLCFSNRDFNLHSSFGAIAFELRASVFVCALSAAPASSLLLKSSLEYLEWESIQESQISIFYNSFLSPRGGWLWGKLAISVPSVGLTTPTKHNT